MTLSSNVQIVFKDYPLILWLMGVLFLFVGAAFPFGHDAQGAQARVLMLLGVSFLSHSLPS